MSNIFIVPIKAKCYREILPLSLRSLIAKGMCAWNLLSVACSLLVANASFPNLYIEGELWPAEEVKDDTCQFLGILILLLQCKCGSSLPATPTPLLVNSGT